MAQNMIFKIESVSPPPPKRIRIDKDGDASTVPPKLITDLDKVCLGKVFRYLGIKDLLNVALLNKTLKKGTELAFMQLNLENVAISNSGLNIVINNYQKSIVYTDKELPKLRTLQFLRCFGHLIRRLHIKYRGINAKFHIGLELYIADFCAATLIEIHIQWVENTFKYLNTTFPNVECVSIESKNKFSGEPTILKSWFPKMYRLNLEIDWYHKPVWKKYFDSLMKSNPEIRHLNLRYWNIEFLGSVGHSPNLETLEIHWHCFNVKKLNNANIRIGNVRVFNYYDYNDMKHLDHARIPQIKFDQLEELGLPSCRYINDSVFFGKHPAIQKLTVGERGTSFIDFSEENQLKMKNDFPSLTELRFNFIITIDEAVLVTKALTTLKIFTFDFAAYRKFNSKIQTESKIMELFVGFNVDWDVSISAENINAKVNVKFVRKMELN